MTFSGVPAEPLSSRRLIQRLLRDYLGPQWMRLALAMLCAVAVAVLTGLLMNILGDVVKRIFVQKRIDSLFLIVPLIVAVGLLRGFFQVGQVQLVNRLGHGIVGQMQAKLFVSLLHADLARLRQQHSGAFVSSVLYDAGLIREGLTTGVVNYTQNALTVVVMIGVMIAKDPYLTIAVLIAAPLASTIMQTFAKRTRRAAEGAMEETSTLSTAVMENLDGIKIVKIDNREAFEEARVAEVIQRRQRHIIKGANARAVAAPVTETLTTLVTAAVIGYAGWRAVHNQLTVDALVVFLGALAAAAQALRQVANLQSVIAEGLTAARRLFEALDVKPEVGDAPDATPLQLSAASVRFDRVSFGYSPSAPALSDVSIEVRRGETVALVGPSGGGKSTILNLIPRFYDVTAGHVLIDGQDVRHVSLASLRHQIALVTQEPFLFDDTIRANIAYARPEATADEVEEAARAAAAHEFIAALPDGYDTQAGEAGARLSGGQRQRIAIARAFLKNAPILLLDEATSALDTESEQKVQEALERLMHGRTTLMIAHRLSTVRGADRIYVIEAGRVVEQGGHAALVAADGLYARLARAQNLDVPLQGPTPVLGDVP
jgi:ATP-binding cassette, subfamily B, bacterial MsbA